ncbi:hypothetical protein Tco_0438894 [Tanacetum coccineum]
MKRRLFKGRVKSSTDKSLDEEDASKLGRNKDKRKLMFKESDFDGIHDDSMQDVEEEIVDATITGVSTVSAPITTVGVTISTAEPRTHPTTTIVFDDEDVTMAMAQTLIKMKEHKAKEKGVSITDVEDSSRIVKPVRSTTTLQPLPTIDPKDKGKGVLVKEEYDPLVKIKRRDQELERRQKERERQEEASKVAIVEMFDEVQARMDADYELTARLTHEEQEMYTIEERASQLKGKTYDEIHELYERVQKRIQDFILMDSEKEVIKDSGNKDNSSSKSAGGSRRKNLARKRTGKKQSKESAKRQKLKDAVEEQEPAESDEEAADYEQEKEELRMWLTVVLNEEETMDPEILFAKFPIVDWES